MPLGMGALYVAEALGIAVYELADMSSKAQTTRVADAWVIYVRSGLRRQERDRAILRMLGLIRQKTLSSTRSETTESISLH
jgi:hypothetical protein